MIHTQLQRFGRIYSIELAEHLYRDAVSRFAGDCRVVLVHGDSGKKLPEIMGALGGPAIFWLDGHHSGGMTARGEKDCPIVEELDVVLGTSSFDHVLLIDDERMFGVEPDYPATAEIRSMVLGYRSDYVVEVKDDIIRCVPPR